MRVLISTHTEPTSAPRTQAPGGLGQGPGSLMSFTYSMKVSASRRRRQHRSARAPPRRRPRRGSLLELPLLAAHGAVLLHLLRVQPLEDAVHVEAVGALAPHQRAVVAWHLTCAGTGRVWVTQSTPTAGGDQGRDPGPTGARAS